MRVSFAPVIRLRRLTVLVLAMLVVIAAVLTGCATDTAPADAAPADAGSEPAVAVDAAHDGLVIVAGVHQGMPSAHIPVELERMLRATVAAGAPLSVVANDGSPRVTFHVAGYPISDKNPDAHENSVAAVLTRLVAEVRDASAASNGNNLSTSIAVAADQLTADGARHGAVVVIDNGLSDDGYPAMTTPGMLDTDQSADVISLAASSGQGLELEATTLYLVGLGYTAPPQEPLTTVQVRVLSQTWVAYLESAGARVVEVTTPRSGEGPDTGFTTTLVAPGEYEQIDVRRTDTTVEADLPADLLFDSGSAVLRDDAATRSALTEAARFLAANPGPVTITGHTDTIGSTEANELLGQQRGAVIRDWLVEQEGVDPSRLTVRSAGETEPLIPDATEPEQHQQNRRVTITVLTPAG